MADKNKELDFQSNFILFIYFFKKYLFIHLAALGLSCSMWELVP